MATASFDKSFVVQDKESIEQLHKDLESPRKVVVRERDYEAEKEKGIELLTQQLSHLETC